MKSRIIEVEDFPPVFWGSFLVITFDEEWERKVMVSDPETQRFSLLAAHGWTREHLLVVDLGIGRGAMFHTRVDPRSQIAAIDFHFSPFFLCFLDWLWAQDLSDLDALPEHIVLDGPLSDLRADQPAGG